MAAKKTKRWLSSIILFFFSSRLPFIPNFRIPTRWLSCNHIPPSTPLIHPFLPLLLTLYYFGFLMCPSRRTRTYLSHPVRFMTRFFYEYFTDIKLLRLGIFFLPKNFTIIHKGLFFLNFKRVQDFGQSGIISSPIPEGKKEWDGL